MPFQMFSIKLILKISLASKMHGFEGVLLIAWSLMKIHFDDVNYLVCLHSFFHPKQISWESTTLGFWYTELLERNAQFRTWFATERPKVHKTVWFQPNFLISFK